MTARERKPDMKAQAVEIRWSLDKSLAFYRMTPQVVIINYHPWKARTMWRPVLSSKQDQRRRHARERTWDALGDDDVRRPGALLDESGALINALRLIESGLIWKVQPCRCGKYLFRKFSTQRFCSEKCRIAEFRNSDEARLKRNAYARELYHAKKTLEEGKRRR